MIHARDNPSDELYNDMMVRGLVPRKPEHGGPPSDLQSWIAQ